MNRSASPAFCASAAVELDEGREAAGASVRGQEARRDAIGVDDVDRREVEAVSEAELAGQQRSCKAVLDRQRRLATASASKK